MPSYKNFVHLSGNKINKLHKITQKINWKPKGIYCSKNGEWVVFLKKHLHDDKKKYKYKLDLDKDADIMELNDVKSVDVFLDKYGTKKGEYLLINWILLAKTYDGIFVPKKLIKNIRKNHSCMKYLFVTMFDIETLCVWNIKKIRLFEKNA